jgi:hypothetical protein
MARSRLLPGFGGAQRGGRDPQGGMGGVSMGSFSRRFISMHFFSPRFALVV